MSTSIDSRQSALSVSYSFVSDWKFYRTAFARYRQQRPNRRRGPLVTLIVAVILLIASIYGYYSAARWTPIPLMALIGGIVGGSATFALGKILAPLRVKRLPNYGATIVVTLDEHGFRAVEPHAQVTLAWSAFSRIVRFADGLLLIRGRVIHWLPDSALQSSTPEEALALVRTRKEVVVVG